MRSAWVGLLLCASVAGSTQARAEEGGGGLVLGAAFGLSSIRTSVDGLPAQAELTGSFPNFKVGAMLRRDTALLLHLPGSIYRYKGSGRERDRGFEGVIPSLQFWPLERWWVMGGVGLTLDAPAFYDVKSKDEGTFHLGPSVTLGTGYEVFRAGRFAVDVQGRGLYGSARVPEGTRKALAFNLLAGINWYQGR
jgi:hypothetical protein